MKSLTIAVAIILLTVPAQAGAPASRGEVTCDTTSVHTTTGDGATEPEAPTKDQIQISVIPAEGFVITEKQIVLKKTMQLEKPGAVHKPGTAWSHSESVNMTLERATGKLRTVHTMTGKIMRKSGEVVTWQSIETIDGLCSQTSGPAGLLGAK